MAMWKVQAHFDVSEGALHVPTFYVEASSTMEAGERAVRVLTEGRALSGPAHYSLFCEETYRESSGHILREEDEMVPSNGVIFRLEPEQVVPRSV